MYGNGCGRWKGAAKKAIRAARVGLAKRAKRASQGFPGTSQRQTKEQKQQKHTKKPTCRTKITSMGRVRHVTSRFEYLGAPPWLGGPKENCEQIPPIPKGVPSEAWHDTRRDKTKADPCDTLNPRSSAPLGS